MHTHPGPASPPHILPISSLRALLTRRERPRPRHRDELVVVDTKNDRLQVYRTDGVHARSIEPHFFCAASVEDVAAGHGNLYVTGCVPRSPGSRCNGAKLRPARAAEQDCAAVRRYDDGAPSPGVTQTSTRSTGRVHPNLVSSRRIVVLVLTPAGQLLQRVRLPGGVCPGPCVCVSGAAVWVGRRKSGFASAQINLLTLRDAALSPSAAVDAGAARSAAVAAFEAHAAEIQPQQEQAQIESMQRMRLGAQQ